MNPLYPKLEATARRLIDSFGKPAKLLRTTRTGSAYNPIVTETQYDITLVETQLKLENRQDTLIQVGDKAGIISTSGEAPQFDDKLSFGGEVYYFVELKPLNPGGLDMLYKFIARK